MNNQVGYKTDYLTKWVVDDAPTSIESSHYWTREDPLIARGIAAQTCPLVNWNKLDP